MSRDPAWAGVPIASTTGSWQRRQFASAIARLAGSARIGSGNTPRREVVRVPEAVAWPSSRTWRQRVGHVTVVAHGDRAMAALDPAVVLLVHDVAVRAGPRVVGHVGPASRVHKRVRAEPERHPEHQHGDRKRDAGAGHPDASSCISEAASGNGYVSAEEASAIRARRRLPRRLKARTTAKTAGRLSSP